MRSINLHTLNTRNKIMLIFCWALTLLGAISAYPSFGLIKTLYMLGAGIATFVVPTLLVWKKLLDKWVMYLTAILLIVLLGFMEPSLELYMLTFLFSGIFSLYFDFRPVLFIGIVNIAYTIYFVNRYHEVLFASGDPIKHMVPLISIHLLLTLALITQSLIGEKLRSNSQQMEHLSKTDAQTGLYNHKTFHDHLENLIIQHKQGKLDSLQLAILDIDNFKQINDSYGHAVGDLIIERAAKMIVAHTTADDFVVRYGGEEFAIVFTNKTMKQAYTVAESIRKDFMKMRHTEIERKPVTISIGLTALHGRMNKAELFDEADKLLYEAKRRGKNQTVMR